MGVFNHENEVVINDGDEKHVVTTLYRQYPFLKTEGNILGMGDRHMTVVAKHSENNGVLFRGLYCTMDEQDIIADKIDLLFSNFPFSDEAKNDFKSFFLANIEKAIAENCSYSRYTIDVIDRDNDGAQKLDHVQLGYSELDDDGNAVFLLEIVLFVGDTVSEAKRFSKQATLH